MRIRPVRNPIRALIERCDELSSLCRRRRDDRHHRNPREPRALHQKLSETPFISSCSRRTATCCQRREHGSFSTTRSLVQASHGLEYAPSAGALH
jgi:hypothetical protein